MVALRHVTRQLVKRPGIPALIIVLLAVSVGIATACWIRLPSVPDTCAVCRVSGPAVSSFLTIAGFVRALTTDGI